MVLSIQDLEDLKRAVDLLESPSLAARLTSAFGSSIEKLIHALPAPVAGSVHEAARKAIAGALELALTTLDDPTAKPPSDRAHQVLSGVSGALGGFFGAPAMTLELPVSTLIMLRSIADIARSEGENITQPEVRLACLEVFALGGRSSADDSAETGYYALRAALASSIAEVARYVARRSMVDRSTPALARLVTLIASRFSITASEKFAAQAIPVLGALGGASINLLFIQHFQNMARGHFRVRRLERRYGKAVIEAEYRRLLAGGHPGRAS